VTLFKDGVRRLVG